jgi:hypothetical protein
LEFGISEFGFRIWNLEWGVGIWDLELPEWGWDSCQRCQVGKGGLPPPVKLHQVEKVRGAYLKN